MVCLIGRWSLPAAFAAAVLALAACAGNTGSPVPLAFNQIQPAGFQGFGAGLHAATTGVLPAACPKGDIECFTVSLKKGLTVDWCYGPKSNPCDETSKYTWSGAVCTAKAKTCKPIEQMTAKWTGPFACKKAITICGKKFTSGDEYVVDKISIGKTPPKQTKSYAYKQEIELDSAAAGYIGLNVGP